MRSWTLLLVVGAMTLMLAAASQANEGEWGEVPAEPASEALESTRADDAGDAREWAEAPVDDPMEAAPAVAEDDSIHHLEAEGNRASASDPGEASTTPSDTPSEGAEASMQTFDAQATAADGDAGWGEVPVQASSAPTHVVSGPYLDDPESRLGPQAVDEDGVQGRIHTVVSGDTLWDISASYLGTPWVWPTVWQDNDEIEDPHRIDPGDRIWITAGEMRVVSDSEAQSMIDAREQLVSAEAGIPADDLEYAAMPANEAPTFEDGGEVSEESLMDDQVPAAMDQLPVGIPVQATSSNETGASVRVAELEAMGFITANNLEAATSIVESPNPRTLLVAGDMLYIGLGEGQTEVGDEFTLFRDVEEVRDVGGGHLLGYHVEVLGWAVVREVRGETSIAEIRMSQASVVRGDRMVPRQRLNQRVPIRFSPEGVDGHIVYLPKDRTIMGDGDYVYLNRGTLHGYEVGSALEVVYPGRVRRDGSTGQKVMTPDHIVGKIVLVDVRPDSSVGFVVRASVELEVGDVVRPARHRVAGAH